MKMSTKDLIYLKKQRLNTLKSNGKNVDSSGVCKRLEREIRNLEKTLDK